MVEPYRHLEASCYWMPPFAMGSIFPMIADRGIAARAVCDLSREMCEAARVLNPILFTHASAESSAMRSSKRAAQKASGPLAVF